MLQSCGMVTLLKALSDDGVEAWPLVISLAVICACSGSVSSVTSVFEVAATCADRSESAMPSVRSTSDASAWLAQSLKVQPWSKVPLIRFLVLACIPKQMAARSTDRMMILFFIRMTTIILLGLYLNYPKYGCKYSDYSRILCKFVL